MDREYFKNPKGKPEYSSGCFWFWNDKIEEKEMLRQQSLMAENGVGMPMIHSRFGREIDYMGEQWMQLVKASLAYSKKTGQKVWLYDEDNWPSGTCSKSVTKEERFREHFLRCDKVNASDRKAFFKNIRNEQILEIWNSDGSEVLWTADKALEENSLDTNIDIKVVYWEIKPYNEGGRSCVDYLNPEAIACFLEKTHKTYKSNLENELFELVEGFFMDETRFYYCYPWTLKFPQEFEKRKGYSILGNLIKLFGDGVRTTEELDYLDVAAQLYKEATFWQVYHWCEKNHVLSAAHLLGEETLAAQTRFEIDLMRQYEAMHVPGLDHLGKGIGSLDARFVVSAARNYGKNRICCEAFGASGEDTSIEDVIRVSNWLLQQGVNMLIAHGYYYSTRGERKNDFPPSYFFQFKDWDKMRAYNEMASRMMQLNSDGKFWGNILVYYPIETFWKYYRPDPWEKTGFGENGSRIIPKKAAQIDHEYQIFLNLLEDLNVPYQIITNDSMKNYQIKKEKWVNSLNQESFHTIVFFDAEIIPSATKERLEEFSKNGGSIFHYNSAIDSAESKKFLDVEELANACAKITDIGIEVLEGTKRCQHNLPAYPDHLIDPYIHNGEDLYGVGISRYDKAEYRIYNFTNYNLREEKITVKLKDVKHIELWNPENGEQTILEGEQVMFSIPPNRTRYIVTYN